MSTINYTYNVIVDRFRQFAAGHFQLRRFTHGEISQADLEKEAEWPWLHVKPRAINYSPGTRSFQFEIFISDLPRDKEDKTGYQAESITDCSLIFQDLINEIYLGNMFGSDVVLTRPVSSEPFVEQYTHTLTGVTGTIELNLDYDWSACSIPASWNYNTPTDSGSDGWGALQFIESLDQNGVYVSLLNDIEAPGNSYYYGTNASGVKGWYAIVDNVGLTCEDLPECATIISIVDDIAALQTDKVDKIAGKGLSTEDYTTAEKSKLAGIEAGAEVNVNADWNAVSGDAQILNKPSIPAAQVNSDWNATSGVAQILNKPTIPSIAGLVPETRTLTINGTTQDLSANRTFTIASNPGTVTSVAALTLGTTGTDLSSTVANGTSTPVITLNVPTASATNRGALSSADWSTFNGKFTLPTLTSGSVLFSNGTTIAQNNANFNWDNTNSKLSLSNAAGTLLNLTPGASDVALAINNNGYIKWGAIAYMRGNSTSTLFSILNSSFTNIFNIGTSAACYVNTGSNFLIGTTTDAGYKLDVNGTARFTNTITGFNLSLGGGTVSATTHLTINGTNSAPSGTSMGISNNFTFFPNSGNANATAFSYQGIINQTGTATGITRGLYINPTLTAAADFRAIEVASGITILGAATTAKASLRIPSGTAPTSPVNGDIWFDGTNLNVRIAGVTRTIVVL